METVAGSHLYGTATDKSDVDIRGIFIPSDDYFFGCYKNIKQIEEKATDDIVFYDIRKFFSLASDCNPNIVELFFIPFRDSNSSYRITTDIWRRIVINRNLFISKKCRWTFSGYAVSQLKRIKRHRSWLLNPPKEKPERINFGLPEDRLIVDKEQIGAFDALQQRSDNRTMYISSNMLDALQKEKQYSSAMNEWKQYLNWKENRNPERAELEKKYGYDTKHASHLVRLIIEGIELLSTEYITLPLSGHNIKTVMDVRNGKYTYDELMDFVGDIDEQFDKYYETSELRHSPDKEAIEDLCIDIIRGHLYKNNK